MPQRSLNPNLPAEILDSLEDALVGVVRTDVEGRIEYANRQWCRMVGYALDELRDLSVIELTAPDSVEASRAAIARILEGSPAQALSKRYRRKDGSVLQARSSLAPVHGSGGAVVGLIAFVVDQGELVHAVESAEAAEERLQDALAIGQMLAWEWDTRSNVFLASSDAAEFWGRPVASAAEFVELVHPEDRGKIADMLRLAHEGTVPYELEYRLVGPDGQIRWMQTRRRIDRGPEGALTRVRGITVDVTTSKQAEVEMRLLAEAGRALGESLDYETTLANLAPVLVPQLADWYAVDLLTPEDELERIAVHHPDPAKVELGRRLHVDYPTPKDAPIGTWEAIRSGRPSWIPHLTDEMFVQGARDDEHLVLLRALALRSFVCVPMLARGVVIGVITLVYAESGRRYAQHDVDLAMQIAGRAAVAVDNARLFRALQDADRRKDEFLAMLAHELRNPLAPINMAAELLRMVGSENPHVQRAAGIIGRQVGHMSELVDDLLDVSRVTRGLVELQSEPVDVKVVLSSAVEQVQALVSGRHHTLHTRLAPESLMVVGDHARLIQVVANLLTNAAKYTPPGGEIELHADAVDDRVRIRVCDNGLGIEPALLPQIFELFTQAERTPDRTQGGLGIGLALVRSLVRLQGGEVKAESRGPGHGSTFTVLLPRYDAVPGHAGEDTIDAPQPDKGRRILLVDDNEDAAAMSAAVLRLHGHAVDIAATGREALERAGADTYDVFVLDLGLPDMTGHQLARQLRQFPRCATAHFIALTGYGQPGDRAASRDAGFTEHLVKPADLQRLLHAVGKPLLRP